MNDDSTILLRNYSINLNSVCLGNSIVVQNNVQKISQLNHLMKRM